MRTSNQFPQHKPKRTVTWKLVDSNKTIFQNTFGSYAVCMHIKNQQPLAIRKTLKIIPYSL